MSYKVLVLIKPGDQQPALERVAEFARFMPNLEIVCCRVVSEDVEESKSAALAQAYEVELNKLLKHYPTLATAKTKIVVSKDVAKSFCEVAADDAEHFDLAIISANRREALKDLFFSTIDSQIMRKIMVPVLIVKDPHAPQRLDRAIVLAIDFEAKDHSVILDEVLYTSAEIFAKNFNGEVHLLNCVPPVHRGFMMGNTHNSVMFGGTTSPLSRRDEHAAAVLDFAKAHDVPVENCHVAEGRVDEMIPKVCKELNARMVCMGTSTKDGLLHSLDQSAGELVLEQIHGDIFIVNKHVQFSKLQAKTE